jgi:serine/threonine protein kinase
MDIRQEGALRSRWLPNPETSPQQLAEAIQHAESSPDTTVLKEDRKVLVFRATLFGQPVLVKRYQLATGMERMKYLLRPSRARRFLAVAQVLQSQRVPAPAPIGLLEIREGQVPVTSYVITKHLDETTTVRDWLETEYQDMTTEQRQTFARHLQDHLTSLYRAGIYHRDTKLTNILVQETGEPARPKLYWIDLECVQCGVFPSRHQIVRNLVQLNGSIVHLVSPEDRQYFLKEMATRYPWVLRPVTVNKIRRWTRKRLNNEVLCGVGP